MEQWKKNSMGFSPIYLENINNKGRNIISN